MPDWVLTGAQILFAVLAVCTVFEWRQLGQRDGLARAFEYAAAAAFSFYFESWWPLILGLVFVFFAQRAGLNRI